MRDLKHSVLKVMSVEEKAERLKEPEWMEDTKETVSSRYNRTGTHMSSRNT